jgi:chromosome segregation ATPase
MEANWAGTHSSFTASSLRFFVLILQCSEFVALTTELATARKAMFEEKAARSAIDRALPEKKAAQRAVNQSLLSSNKANALLSLELEFTQVSLTATTDKLSSKSSALNTAVIREQQMKIQLMTCEEKLTVANDKLKAIEEKMKIRGQLLDSAQQALSK